MDDQRIRISEICRKTCKIMLTKRGYKNIKDGDDNTMTASKQNNPLIVYFNKTDKFNSESLKRCVFDMDHRGMKHCIIIYRDDITPATRKNIQESSLKLELFKESELMFDITEHVLQPIFSCINQKNARDVLGVDYDNIGIMKLSDPIAKFYGYLKGDVVKIEQKNGCISYRRLE